MSTIVLHCDSLAVTEYETDFTGLAGDYEATASGVHRVGGALDGTTQIASTVAFGLSLADEKGRQQRPRQVVVHGTGLDDLRVRVTDTEDASYSYEATQIHRRAARFKLGKGLRDNYLQISLLWEGDAAFVVDRVEFDPIIAQQRRL